MYRADLVPVGLNIVRSRLGEEICQFILMLGRGKKLDSKAQRDLTRIGALVGLNAAEVSATAGIAQAINALPLWIKALLVIVAIIAGIFAGIFVVGQATYVPGTLYASTKPEDFFR